MKNRMKIVKARGILILIGLCLVLGCLQQRYPFDSQMPEDQDQCVTPIQKVPADVSSDGISITQDGTVFGVAGGYVSLYNNKGNLLWTREDVGSRFALLIDDGTALLAQSYNSEEEWKTSVAKLDSEGNTLWERQVGSIGVDGLAVNSDGSFIAVGATDKEDNGHLMLFDQDGNKLWDHQIDGRIEIVTVSKSGYVAAGPRDRNIYLYDCHGELIFEYDANSVYSEQDAAIAPDESFFLFGSEHQYIDCYTLKGELLWQREIGPLCNIRISADGQYIAVCTTKSTLFLLDRNGNELWSKKVTDAFFIEEVAISAHAEYIAVNIQEGSFLPRLYVAVYSREGDFLWRYEGSSPFMAVAVSSDGHYIAAGNSNFFLIFDNFAAIEEYAASECAQLDKSLLFYRFISI